MNVGSKKNPNYIRPWEAIAWAAAELEEGINGLDYKH
jgi:hypothetical protein